MNYQVQLSIQLLDVGRVVKYSASKIAEFLPLARDLRKTIGDVFVEEEVAEVFGRARIRQEIIQNFKSNVLSNTSIVPLHKGSPIALSIGAGPTLNKALRDKDPKYLNTVIQLSFLSRYHDRPGLSLVLSRCMEKRTGIHIGVQLLEHVLEACSSQTSVALWDSYVHTIEQGLRQTAMDNGDSLPTTGLLSSYERSPSNTAILAGLDYFFLVQNLPDNRKTIMRTCRGIIAMVAWAHSLLGLTVQVKDRQGRVTTFGDSREVSSVFVQEIVPESNTEEEMLLLDADGQVVLRCDNDLDHISIDNIEQERHALLDWGSENMRGFFNCQVLIPDDDPVYTNIANLIVPLAMDAAAKLTNEGSEINDRRFRNQSIEACRIFDSAKILFHSLALNKKDLKAGIEHVQGKKIAEFLLPPSVQRIYKMVQTLQPSYAQSESEHEIRERIEELAFIVLTFAHSYDITQCSSLPICLDWDHLDPLSKVKTWIDIRSRRESVQVSQDIFFSKQSYNYCLGRT